VVSPRTDMTDIRDWLRANRPDLDVQPKGQIRKAHIAIYQQAHGTPAAPVPDESGPDRTDGPGPDRTDEPGPDRTAPDTPETTAGETAPAPAGRARPGWLGGRRRPKTPGAGALRRRVPVDGLLSMGWQALAHLTRTDATLPVSRIMEIQAPAAGMVLDDALRGSLADRILQPFARTAKRGEAFWAVAGPPFLVAAVCQQPELYDVVRPLLRDALKSWVIMAGPKMRRAREREAKLLEELDGDLESIDAMIDALFAPPQAPPAAQAAQNGSTVEPAHAA
jgi:hypothetical protein